MSDGGFREVDEAVVDTGDMSAVLSTPSMPKPEQNFVGAPKDKKEAENKAREHGYTAPVPYDYSAYQDDGKGSDMLASATRAAAAQAARYEWKGEYGEVGPKIPELEAILFSDEFKYEAGTQRDRIEDFRTEITSNGDLKFVAITNFDDAGLHPVLMETLALMHYDKPTPIQTATIPAILNGKDIVATAQTGSGKTASYLIPIISLLMGKAKKMAAKRPDPSIFNPNTDRVRAEPLVLIVCPTRELALQIFDECRRLCYRTMLRPCVAYGGGPMARQIEELSKGCDILVATPGRLKALVEKPSILSLRRVRHTVMDEADELMHSDWDENMRMIMTSSDLTEDADSRYYMFSATFPKEFRKVAKTFMAEDWVRIRVGRTGSSHENIKQVIMFVDDNKKRDAIWHVLFANPPCRTMVFVNSKKNADILDDFLFNKGLPTTSIHADRTQREREDSIISFRQGTSPILITTGVAARGLDIKHVLHVINYDLPSGMHDGLEEYVHRIGRTARIGHEGRATSFYNARNEELAEGLVKLLIESHQPVPEFLNNYKPLDDQLTWDDDSDEGDEAAEEAADGAIAGGGWGDVPPEPGFTANSSAAGNGDSGFGGSSGIDSGFRGSGFAGSSGVDSGFGGSGFDANAAEPVFEW